MVQKKAPDKPMSLTEQKSHVRLERQFSSHLHQDTRIRGGADLKKKLKMVRSMKIPDFDTFEHSPVDIQFKKTSPSKKTSSLPIRNYMKPTSSSDARKGKLQVTIPSVYTNKKRNPRSSKNSSSFKTSSCSPSIKSSIKKSPVVGLCAKKNVNRATCSSTLKDLKFPSALELNHGATEVEGTSKIRVCPYTYCSLNGNMHEPLPPLKCFISARTKLLKNQRSMKIKRLLSFKTCMSEMEGKKIDEDRQNEIGNTPSDFFVEIYTRTQEETLMENNCDEISIQEGKDYELCMLDELEDSRETESLLTEPSDNSFEYDIDMNQSSQFSLDEKDDKIRKAHEDYDEDGEIKNTVIETIKINGLFSFKTCMSEMEGKKIDEYRQNEIGNTPSEIFYDIYTMTQEETLVENNCDEISVQDENDYERYMLDEFEDSRETESPLNEPSDVNFEFVIDKYQSNQFSQDEKDDVMRKTQEVYEEDGKIKNSVIQTMEMGWEEEIGLYPHYDESSECPDEKFSEKELLQETSNGTVGNMLDVSSIDYEEIDSILSSGWNFKRKKTTEEVEQVKKFNPRSPNFLPFEPDPDGEKVDLRHQMMDERKNAEEWMIDYELQKTVRKLDPARKRTVALLVKAFETIIPLQMCEKEPSRRTSVFSHMNFIQVCN